jgi:hypothetical protein
MPSTSPFDSQCGTCGFKGTEHEVGLHAGTEHPDPDLHPLEHARIELAQIPHQGYERGPTNHITGTPSLIPYDKSKMHYSHIVQLGADGPSNRKMVVVNHNGVHVPFYLSSGSAGKDDPSVPEHKRVASGKWYPHFGMGQEGLGGWINKGTSDQMRNHYGSPELAHIAGLLDKHIGDIRDSTDHPMMGASHTMEFINSHLPEAPTTTSKPDKDPEGHARFARNITHITNALRESRRIRNA